MALKRVFARKWVAALRSGDYQQARERLAHQNEDGVRSYCCLGVALDLGFIPGEWVQDESYDSASYGFLPIEEVGVSLACRGMLNKKELGRLGLSQTRQDVLIIMNDGGKPFTEIADKIESWIK